MTETCKDCQFMFKECGNRKSINFLIAEDECTLCPFFQWKDEGLREDRNKKRAVVDDWFN